MEQEDISLTLFKGGISKHSWNEGNKIIAPLVDKGKLKSTAKEYKPWHPLT